MRTHTSLALITVALICAPAVSQTPKPAEQHTAGLGTVKRWFNASTRVPAAISDDVISGVGFANGEEYIGTRSGTISQIVVTKNGKYQRRFATPFSPSGGTYDMDTDGKVIFAISAAGVIVFDANGKTTGLSVQTKNGPKALSKNPIPIPFVLLPYPAGGGVAFDPTGNSGNGSLFVVSHTSTVDPIYEIKLDGTKIKTYANQGWLGSGLTRDPRTGNLWCMHSPTGGQLGGGMDIIELDINNNLMPTGNRIMQGTPGLQRANRCCGGLCGIPGGDPHSYPSDFDIAVLDTQPGNDFYFVHRVHLNPGILGYNEAFLEGSINSTTLTRGGFDGDLWKIKANDVLRFGTNAGKSGQKGKFAVILINFGPDAARTGSQPLISPELSFLAPYTVPSSTAVLELYGLLGSTPILAKLPPNILGCFRRIRFQAVYFDPKARGPFGVVATNELFTHVSLGKSCNITVEAVGADSFNAITTSGFFRVIHTGGLPITKVEFDLLACRDLLQTEMRFDTNNPNMADQFNFGNSTQAGAKGTYRNGSDVACGLIYDNLNTPVGPGTSTGANTGWIGRGGAYNGSSSYHFKIISFRVGGLTFAGTASNPKVF